MQTWCAVFFEWDLRYGKFAPYNGPINVGLAYLYSDRFRPDHLAGGTYIYPLGILESLSRRTLV